MLCQPFGLTSGFSYVFSVHLSCDFSHAFFSISFLVYICFPVTVGHKTDTRYIDNVSFPFFFFFFGFFCFGFFALPSSQQAAQVIKLAGAWTGKGLLIFKILQNNCLFVLANAIDSSV